jgi:hypothetical protein
MQTFVNNRQDQPPSTSIPANFLTHHDSFAGKQLRHGHPLSEYQLDGGVQIFMKILTGKTITEVESSDTIDKPSTLHLLHRRILSTIEPHLHADLREDLDQQEHHPRT